MKEGYLNEIKRRLVEVLRKENFRSALTGLYNTLSLLALSFLFFALIELLCNFSPGVRTFIFVFILAANILFLFSQSVLPLVKNLNFFSEPDLYRASLKVGSFYPDIKDELTNALQLIWNSDTKYSTELIEAAFERIYRRAENHDFKKIVDFSGVRSSLNKTIFSVALTLLTFFLIPGLASAGNRLLKFRKDFVLPQKFYFEIKPGNAEITKGDPIDIQISTRGEDPGKITVSTKYLEQTDFESKEIRPDSSGIYNFKISSVKSTFEYFAAAENIESDIYTVDVINRPIINALDETIMPPQYTKLPEIVQRDNGNIAAYPGSRIMVKLNTSRALSKAEIVFVDSTRTQMLLNGSSASTGFRIFKSGSYKIIVTDNSGYTNLNPIEYEIKTLTDEYPSLEIASPNKDVKLGTDSKLPVIAKVKDDFGFSRMNLNFRLSSSKYRGAEEQFTQLPVPVSASLKEDDIYYVWDLSPLFLAEGEAVSYYLEIFDNDNISGPKSAKSRLYTVFVPSLDELFSQAENVQNNAEKDLRETLEEAKKLNDEMNKIRDDLRTDKKDITWEEKERIEKALEKFKEIGEKIDDVSNKMNEMQKDLMQNNLLSEETLKKYMELQKLMDELDSDELREAFKRMNDALQNLMRENVQQALDNLKANEEYFKKSIERTLNLLKRIQIEQKLDELVKRTDDLSQKIDELKEKTGKSNLEQNSERNELSRKQDDAASDLDRLQDEMEKLSEKMQGLKDMPKEQLDKLNDELKQQNNQKLAKDASENLSQKQKSQALQNQQQISSNMQKMSKQLSEIQESMRQMNQMQTFMDMAKILDDLLKLSKDQENLKNSTENSPPISSELNKNARNQNEIQSNLGRVLQKMSGLSQKSFAITPEMGKALGKAFGEMNNSMNSLQNQNGSGASQNQGKAMSYLNEAAMLMKSAMDQMMSGGQGGGMMSMMQQLQQLSQQQMNLNQLTQMMKEGQLTQQQMAEMQRLAQQQELIRKSLDQLNEEAKQTGQSKRLAANLEKILQDMQEVVTNLKSEKIDDNLVKAQDKILSRLLDAQRSMNERDFEKERESTAGQNINRNSPPDLILSTEDGKNKLRDELMKAIREGYKKDYEDLIRKYFEALEKSERK